ncbi:hypothetical protein SAMN05428642_1156 [Flaviramulus basaltis]|uniref:Uncharacterized protein n=1 Tax=Flaviramulus basaltis TaxID=369401 RepID=A0A1K2ISH9_9FLAO|nr:hypothetical protein [Flaviramulus basaltis]SFZ95210.1 hypothetical protein SAMN05428642_1156 [Flaviramulus basaltis]
MHPLKMEEKKQITIHNIKSNQYRQIHSDGASAGITPSGLINISFYSHRNVIPKGTIFELENDGRLGKLVGITDDSKSGIVREYDFGVHMDVNTCKSIRDLMDEKIKEYEKLTK